ncbi:MULTISPECIES: hypothetical protein [Pseudomonas]|uniref:Uncharacterized protein n=1 Tax=Pseudomonas triticicola TaxID=2842345 RepID=A0ABS6RRQ6_9PSED|nr:MULTISPECIES: hypothetical protein [Pseudomonas]MBV4548582.1 hypothetical protein [Pseudomonas triticicola]QXI22750.1 hypothetical protein HU724_000275 [Pseudomonas iranensis]
MASLKWVLMISSLFSATNVSARRSAALLPRYRDAMSAAGKAQKIPQRVVERSEIQGLRQ